MLILEEENPREWYHEFEELAKKVGCAVEPIITYEPTGGDGAPLPGTAIQQNKRINLEKKIQTLGKRDIIIAMTRFSATGPRIQFDYKSFMLYVIPGIDIETGDPTGHLGLRLYF